MKRAFRSFLVVAAILGAAPLAAAPAAAQVEIVDYGIYDLTITRRVKSDKDVAGEYNEVENVRLQRQATEINAQLTLNFGFRFRVTDPNLVGETLQLRKIFPKLTNPESGRMGREAVSDVAVSGVGVVYFNLYGFDYSWEMAEGEWIYQVVHKGRVLAEKKFKVVVAIN